MKDEVKRLYSAFLSKMKGYPRECYIDPGVKLRNVKLEGGNRILNKTELTDCEVGYATFIGRYCSLTNMFIGRFCSIGEGVRLIYGKHPTSTIVSTYPAFYSSVAQYGSSFVKKDIFEEFAKLENERYADIGNDVWIGSYAHIMAGVKIGDGAVIGANAVVVKDVSPYSIVVGVPAREIRKRFIDEQIAALLRIKWWNKDLGWIKANAEKFSDIEHFIKEIDT